MDAIAFGAMTVSEFAERTSPSPRVRAFLSALARLNTYADLPEQLSADALILQVQLTARKGVLYLDGGWNQLVSALCNCLKETGRATILTESAVKSIPDAPAVVVALGSPQQTSTILGRAFDVGPPAFVSCVDLGLSAAAKSDFALGIDQPMYLSKHSTAAGLAPSGTTLYSVAQYLGADEPDPLTIDRFIAANGISDADVVMRRKLHRMKACSAIPLAAAGGLAGRPRITATGLNNVFIAGDWVGPEGLLADASVASGLAAADAILANR